MKLTMPLRKQTKPDAPLEDFKAELARRLEAALATGNPNEIVNIVNELKAAAPAAADGD